MEGYLYSLGGYFVKTFPISICSLKQVQKFVALATAQPFEVLVCSDGKQVNAKNFMAIFALNLRQTLQVQVNCDEAAFCQFRQKTIELLAS